MPSDEFHDWLIYFELKAAELEKDRKRPHTSPEQQEAVRKALVRDREITDREAELLGLAKRLHTDRNAEPLMPVVR